MSRQELGSYLGLTLETVSRIISRFRDKGLVDVQSRHISILDAAGLRAITGQEADPAPPLPFPEKPIRLPRTPARGAPH